MLKKNNFFLYKSNNYIYIIYINNYNIILTISNINKNLNQFLNLNLYKTNFLFKFLLRHFYHSLYKINIKNVVRKNY